MHIRNAIPAAILSVLAALQPSAVDAAPSDPPRIGSPADLILDRNTEYAIGRSIYFRLLEARQILDDPLLDSYIQEVGQRVAASANIRGGRFKFFVMDDDRINAFALPGGFIGVNAGLIRATDDESELASVLAHEVAHVTQRHIADRIQASQRADLASLALILAGVIIGAQTDSHEVTEGAIMAGQAAGIQQKINFTRDMEFEADRVGIGYLADAGYDPTAMAEFFDTIGQRARMVSTQTLPEILRTHPVTASRVSEARGRAMQMRRAGTRESRLYGFMAQRLRVLTSERPEDLIPVLAEGPRDEHGAAHEIRRYGLALALLRKSDGAGASAIFADLLADHEDFIPFYVDLARAQIADGRVNEGLITLRDAVRLFPRNRPVTRAYADALMDDGRYLQAHDILLDFLNNVEPRPTEVRQLARAAGEADLKADAYHYMSEYHLMRGEVIQALDQLDRALRTPGIDQYQKARFEARRQEIEDALSEEELKRIRKERS